MHDDNDEQGKSQRTQPFQTLAVEILKDMQTSFCSECKQHNEFCQRPTPLAGIMVSTRHSGYFLYVGLWVGPLEAVNQLLASDSPPITHIVSVINLTFVEEEAATLSRFRHLHLHVADLPSVEMSSDLLHSFEYTSAFIQEALTSGGEYGLQQRDDDVGVAGQQADATHTQSRQPIPTPDDGQPSPQTDEAIRGREGQGAVEGQQLEPHGGVLVHCLAGRSRSATVAAAYLIQAQSLTPEAAVAHIQKVHPSAQPNQGFMRQLQLWYEMGGRITRGYGAYEEYRRELTQAAWEADPTQIPRIGLQLAQKRGLGAPAVQAAAAVTSSSTGQAQTVNQQGQNSTISTQAQQSALFQLPSSWTSGHSTTQQGGSQQFEHFRCRECRTVVARVTEVVSIQRGGGSAWQVEQRAHKSRRRVGERLADGGEGGVVCVDPLKWMEPQICGYEPNGLPRSKGDLACLGCGKKIGKFSWYGLLGPDGQRVTPAFFIHYARVDAIVNTQAEGVATSLGVRKPKLLA